MQEVKHVTQHARERWCEIEPTARYTHPDIVNERIVEAARSGVALDPQLVATVTSCPRRSGGMFIGVRNADTQQCGVLAIDQQKVITVLRLTPTQAHHLGLGLSEPKKEPPDPQNLPDFLRFLADEIESSGSTRGVNKALKKCLRLPSDATASGIAAALRAEAAKGEE